MINKEISICCNAEVVEGFDENLKDHHDPLPVYKCVNCKQTCNVKDAHIN